MPKIIEIKFAEGDKAWVGDVNWTKLYRPCPDCLGEKVWHVKIATGEAFDVPCPSCKRGYEECDGLEQYYEYKIHVWQGTIGQASFRHWSDGGWEFMLQETGVGSGRNYKERDLFETKEEAQASAEAKLPVVEARQMHQDKETARRKRADRPGGFIAYSRGEVRRLKKEMDRWQSYIDKVQPVELLKLKGA